MPKEYEMTKEMGLLNRVGIPAAIIGKMKLSQGDKLTVWMEGDTIMIQPVSEKCDLCQGRGFKLLTSLPGGKKICNWCIDAVGRLAKI